MSDHSGNEQFGSEYPNEPLRFLKGLLWFLFLLSVWMAVALWPYWRVYGFGLHTFDLAYGLPLLFGLPIGVAVILILTIADLITPPRPFPGGLVPFVAVLAGVYIVSLILSYKLPELFGGRSPG